MRFRYSLFTLALFLLGCTTAPSVDLTPASAHKPLHVAFGRACYAPSESGDDKILLLADPIDDPTESSPGDTLAVATSPPIWQVLLIQLHWRSTASPREDALVANNAVLHWYVYGKPATGRTGVLHYVGTGSVSISTDSTGAQVSINHADLKLADQHGEIRDPFGSFQIKADVHAQTNPQLVQQSMEDVDKAIAQADHREMPATTQP